MLDDPEIQLRAASLFHALLSLGDADAKNIGDFDEDTDRQRLRMSTALCALPRHPPTGRARDVSVRGPVLAGVCCGR
jgi:hypothetical protein